MKYPKFFKSWTNAHAIAIISKTEVIKITNYEKECTINHSNVIDSDKWMDWVETEIDESEFKEMYLQAQNNLTLQYHDLFSAKNEEL